MTSIVVEKEEVILSDGTRSNSFAVATSEPTPHSVCRSLTFEAYLTAWDSDRSKVEKLQRQIERNQP